MRQTFQEFVTGERIDAGTIVHATRYLLAEETDDLPPDSMRAQVADAGVDTETIGAALTQLQRDPLALENACLAYLSAAWEQGEDAGIRAAIAEAKQKLPIVEVAILAVVAMYGMYLIATRGVAHETVVRQADGTTRRTTKFHSPTGPLGAIVDILRPGARPTD